MMSADDDPDIPENGAVFSFGKSNFADNIPSKFWIRNDPISQLACGHEHTVVVTETGRVFVFGSNENGQLGQGYPNSAVKPTCIKSLKHQKVVKIACGSSHTVVLTENGNLYGFGGNREGQLGKNDKTEKNEPFLITNLQSVQEIDCGAEDSVFLTKNGQVFLLGSAWNKKTDNSPLELKFTSPIDLISCGYFHTAFVTSNNKLYIIGPNERPSLDIRVEIDQQLEPIEGIDGKITKLSCGGQHTAILTANGKLYTLGDGMYGQLGLGTRNLDAITPELVSGLEHLKLKDVECGENHVAVVSENGTLFVFGDGSHGKLGLDNENFSNQFWPAKVLNFKMYSVEKVSCGGYHTMVLARLRSPEEVEIYGEEDVEPFRSASVESNDVVVSAARIRRHKRDISLPPLKFPGKQIENVETDAKTSPKFSQIMAVKEFGDDKTIENEENDENESTEDESQSKTNLDDEIGADNISDIVSFTNIADRPIGDVMYQTIESEEEEDEDDEAKENANIPDEIISFVNSQVDILSKEENDEDCDKSVYIVTSLGKKSEKNPRKTSILSTTKEKSSKLSETESEDEESDESEVEESEITNEIPEKDLKEASNSKESPEKSENKRKKKHGKTVFNRMFSKKTRNNDKTESENEKIEKIETESLQNSPIKDTSPSKEPVPVISQSSVLCLPSKKIKLQKDSTETENQSVACILM